MKVSRVTHKNTHTHTTLLSANLRKCNEKLTLPKNIFPEVFYIKLSFWHLISNGLKELASTHWHRQWLCYNFLCRIFNKGTQQFDFIKHSAIRKFSYKTKYISQNNGGLIMFFANSRIRFFKLVDSIVNNIEIIQEKKHN